MIDQSNFDEYFFDVRKHPPRRGQVLARFRAIAEFVDGQGKKDIIYVLKLGKAVQAAEVMKKIHCAAEPDCYRVCREICEDLLTMSEQEVEKKPYRFLLEMLFYTEPENVPRDDPRWEKINLTRFDKETNSYRSVVTL